MARMGRQCGSGQQLAQLVQRMGNDHPPIGLATVDFTVRHPAKVSERLGGVIDYMRRVELEVERNVLELHALLPDPPEVDRVFIDDVWGPQEMRHGAILDRWADELGRLPQPVDTHNVSREMRAMGALARLPGVQDMARMLFYLTGMATERCAIWAYGRLAEQLTDLGETAAVETIVVPIRRQEPGHFAYYRLAAQDLAPTLAPWQRWLLRQVRARTFAPVGVRSQTQSGQFGQVIRELAGEPDVPDMTTTIARWERDLLTRADSGVPVPDYVMRAFREALEHAHQQPAQSLSHRGS